MAGRYSLSRTSGIGHLAAATAPRKRLGTPDPAGALKRIGL